MSTPAVIAKITALEGKRAELVAAMQPMLDHVQADEPGTLTYVLLEDAGDDDVLYIFETYTDQAALDAHSTSDTMKSFGASLRGLVAARPEITVCNLVGGKGL